MDDLPVSFLNDVILLAVRSNTSLVCLNVEHSGVETEDGVWQEVKQLLSARQAHTMWQRTYY